MTPILALQQVLAELPQLAPVAHAPVHTPRFSPFSPTAGAAMFWLFIAIVSTAPHVIRFLSHREMQKTLRQALASGQSIDPVVMDKLVESQNVGPRGPEGLLIGGGVVLAGGIGLTIMSYFVTLQAGRPMYAIAGAGIMVAIVGVALLIAGTWMMRRKAGRSGRDATG